MSNAIRDKINSGFQLLIFDTRADLTKITNRREDTVYYVKADETLSNIPVSYTWSSASSNFTILSQNVTDIELCNAKIPFPVKGDANILYYNSENICVYEWVLENNSYRFLCEASSLITQSIIGVVIKYNALKKPKETGINLGYNYTIGFDKRTYIADENNTIYISSNDIINFFIPSDGRKWIDICGNILIPSNNSSNQESLKYMLVSDYDANNDKRIDLANDTLKFGGKTPVYYDNKFNKLVQISATVPSDLTDVKIWYKKI